ncbi:calcium dependent protein kinase CDPK8 [Besnoitia besnoiti]|uniref:Calcium dependent protein kinase CDPK8 n=1 Tax=Besnoitia besnoiti TaxID=94643 RepID=A0A2A9M8J2_BESBE|nr:calcium dependent protein kinase CDPK8 [Besnoitia besnoiti]PFH31957.1 calcium dependent protein kinase CDPK8 [Besnoitia besnoiti]
MWAAGVVLFMLISGVPPFDGNTEAEVASKILTSPVQFLQPCWQHVSEECKDLIRRLLYNPFLSNASPFYSASLPASYEDLASLSGAAARPLSVDFLSVTRATAVPGSFMCAASPFAPWSSPASSASSLPPSSSLPSSPLPSPLPSAPRSSSPSAASSSSPGPPSGCPLSRDGASGEATMQDSFEGIAGQPAEAVSCFPAPTATPAEGSLQTGASARPSDVDASLGVESGVQPGCTGGSASLWTAEQRRRLRARVGGGEPCTGGMGSTVRAADALAPSASLVPSVASGGGAGSSSPPPSPASWISPVSGAFRPAVAVQPPAAAAWLDGALQKSSRRGALGSLVEGGEKRETEIFVGRSSAQAASASGAAPGLGADGARRQAEAAKECVLERDDEARTAQNRPALDRMRERGPQEGEREGAQGQSAETPCAGVQTTVFVATTVTPSSPPGPPAAAVSEQAGCPASSLSPNACWDAASSAELTERQYGTRLSSAKSPSRASSGAATQPPGVFCPLPQLHPPSQSPSPCVAGVSAGAPSAFVPPAAPLSSPPGELPPPQLTPCLSRVPASLCPVKPEEAGVFRCRFLLLLSATAWRCFAALGPLQRALRTVLAREMEDELEVRILREVFCALDRRHRGTLAPDDFVWGLNVAREMVTTECSCWVMVQAKQEALVPSGCVGLHASDSTASLAFSSVSGKREALSCCSSQASLPVDGDPTGGEREPPEQRSRETSATEAADALARFVADRPERISVLAAAPLASAALPPSLHSLLRLASAGDADGDGPAVDQILPYLMNLHALLGVAPPDVLCEYFALPRAPPWTRAALCTHARATEGTAGDAVPQNRDQDDLWTIDDVIAGLDTDGSGSIEFVEFLAATLADVDLAEREALSRAAFRYFDRSFDGLVSYRDLLGLLTLQPASLASPHSPPPSSWCVPPARASYASTPPAASGASFAYSPYPMSASPAGDCARGTGVGGFEDGVCDPGAELELGEGEGFLMDLERVTAANLPLYRAVLKQIQAVDEDKDGFINYDEFLRLLG